MMRSIILAIAVVIIDAVLASNLAAQGGPPPQASVNNRFEWDQAAPNLNEALTYVYKYYLDNSTNAVALGNVSCVGTGSPFLCSVSVPPMSNGNHTIALSAANIAGESPKSLPFVLYFVEIPAGPAGIRIR